MDDTDEAPKVTVPYAREIPVVPGLAVAKPVIGVDEGEGDADKWMAHKCQIYVFTYSGKPVYSRYGSEDSAVGLTGTLQALVSKFSSLSLNNEALEESVKSVVSNGVRFVFLDRTQLVLVCVCKGGPRGYSLSSMERLLKAVYSQLVFVLTEGINRTLEERPNFDVRSLLGGTKPLFTNLISWMNNSMLKCIDGAAVEILPLPYSIRTSITRLMQANVPDCCAWCGLIVDRRLIATSAGQNYATQNIMAPCDLILLLNLLHSSASLRVGESWTPVCLPSLSAEAFVHAYVQFLESNVVYVGVCLSGENADFYTVSQHCLSVKEGLMADREEEGSLTNIPASSILSSIDEIEKSELYNKSFSDLAGCIPSTGELENAQQILMYVKHCAIVLNNSKQLFSSKCEDKSIFKNYSICKELLNFDKLNDSFSSNKSFFTAPAGATASSQQASITTTTDFVFVWTTSEFHFYLTAHKGIDVSVITHVYQWIRQNEQTLFIPNVMNTGESGTRLNPRSNPLW